MDSAAQECTKGQRRPKPLTSQFEVLDLVAVLKPLARLRSPGFSWGGTSYPASHRAAADEDIHHATQV